MKNALQEIYQSKHELWLKILFSSFAIRDEQIKSKIYEFSQLEFRHLKWLSNSLKEQNIEYNYEKYAIDIYKETNFEIFNYLISEIKSCMKEYDPTNLLFARILSDEFYFISYLEQQMSDKFNNANITAFNKKRVYEDKQLDPKVNDAFTLFLLEDSYKKYELILVYRYFQNYTNDIAQYTIYQDMIDESQFYLKSFGEMMAKMGMLAIPRSIELKAYKNKDIKQFLEESLIEHKKAKNRCTTLASGIKHKDISSFFEFILYQENFNMEQIKKSIKLLEQ